MIYLLFLYINIYYVYVTVTFLLVNRIYTKNENQLKMVSNTCGYLFYLTCIWINILKIKIKRHRTVCIFLLWFVLPDTWRSWIASNRIYWTCSLFHLQHVVCFHREWLLNWKRKQSKRILNQNLFLAWSSGMHSTLWEKLNMNLITFQPLHQYPANKEPLKSKKKFKKILKNYCRSWILTPLTSATKMVYVSELKCASGLFIPTTHPA